jgi:divalent anion:Na+ symporter, DASS family
LIPPPQTAVDVLPQGENLPKAWHLLTIFVATIVGIIVKPLPMDAVALFGVTATAVTGTLTIAEALSGFQDTTI